MIIYMSQYLGKSNNCWLSCETVRLGPNKYPLALFEEWLHLSAYYKAKRICHLCHCEMDDLTSPANLFQKTRNQTMQEFFSSSVKIGMKSFLSYWCQFKEASFDILFATTIFGPPKNISLRGKSKSWRCRSCAGPRSDI